MGRRNQRRWRINQLGGIGVVAVLAIVLALMKIAADVLR